MLMFILLNTKKSIIEKLLVSIIIVILLIPLNSYAEETKKEINPDLLLLYGQAMKDHGDYDVAVGCYKKALSIYEQTLGENHLKVGTCLANIARVYSLQNRPADAEILLQRAIKIEKKALGPDHLDVGLDLLELSAVTFQQVKYKDAEKYARDALEVFTLQDKGVRIHLVALGHLYLGQALVKAKKYKESERNLLQSIELYESMGKIPEQEYENVLNWYSYLLRVTGRDSEAKSASAKLQKMRGN